MHPEILRQLNNQRGREMQARAHHARLVRMIKSVRHGRQVLNETEELVLPPIPDYVDGSFHTEGTGHAPVAQRAA
jgi:hypothetical protein